MRQNDDSCNKAGLAAARARGRNGGRKFAITKSQLRLAQAAMSTRDVKCNQLLTHYCNQLLTHLRPIKS